LRRRDLYVYLRLTGFSDCERRLPPAT
jgi:hypothetical protein